MDIDETSNTVTVTHEGTQLLGYRTESPASKPHVDVLGLAPRGDDLDGHNLVLAAPHDHPWHLGLFFCQKLVDGINCWESELHAAEGRTHGYARSGSTRTADHGNTVTLSQEASWHSSEGEQLLDDERTLRIRAPNDSGYLLAWEQQLTALGSARHLSSETIHGHYSGFSIRLQRELTDGNVRVSTADNPAPENGPRGHWCDYSGKVDGRYGETEPYWAGVTMIATEQCRWFTMTEPYGFVAANPTWNAVETLPADESITWRWGVWVHRGRPRRDEIEGAVERFRSW